MIETQELVSALERAAQEAQDVLDVTSLINPDSVSDDELLFAVGNNAVREAASDAVNICGNLAKRLGAALAQVEAEEPKKKEPEIIEKIVEVENTERLEELEGRLKAALDALEDRPETVMPDFEPKPEEPPAGIADLFQSDKPLAPQARALRDLWLQIGHQIQRGEARPDEIRKHERLSSELEFINRHAFDGV